MARTFASKLMDYCIGDISKTRLTNCYKMIATNQNGQYTVLQVIAMKAELKTLRSRITKENPELLNYFMELFGEIVNYEITGNNKPQQG